MGSKLKLTICASLNGILSCSLRTIKLCATSMNLEYITMTLKRLIHC